MSADREFVRCPPKTHSLQAQRMQNLTWRIALGELIDNSLDAGASRIVARFSNKMLQVRDDGKGISDILAIVSQGDHRPHTGSTLGRYGVGAKDAAVWMWGKMMVESVTQQAVATITVDWEHLSRQDDWLIRKPSVEPNRSGEKTGTTLTFSGITRSKPDINKLADDFGYVFMPALRSGKQIVIESAKKRIICRAFEFPPFTSVVQDEFSIDGRGVRLNVGVVHEKHANPKPGFTYIFKDRVIDNTSIGAMGMSTSRISGTIELLSSGWALSRNKNALVDERQQEQLSAAVFERVKGLLEDAESQGMALDSESFTQELNASFQSAISHVHMSGEKERRDSPKNNTGAVRPKNTGRQRKRFSKTQPGKRSMRDDIAKRLATNGRIDWMSGDSDSIGRVDLAGAVIWLNENNETLRELKSGGDKPAILITAFGLFASEYLDSEQKDVFPLLKDYSEWPELMARLIQAVRKYEMRENNRQ